MITCAYFRKEHKCILASPSRTSLQKAKSAVTAVGFRSLPLIGALLLRSNELGDAIGKSAQSVTRAEASVACRQVVHSTSPHRFHF